MTNVTATTTTIESMVLAVDASAGRTHWANFLLVSAILGMIVLLKWTIGLIAFTWRNCFRSCCQSRDRLYQLYGLAATQRGRSWAVVTGGSDGIGLEMCKNLAKDAGFNICMVARNEAKMKEKLAEVQALRPDIQTKYIVADFAKLNTLKDYQEVLGEQLADTDIGMLVLNAGFGEPLLFEDATDEEIE